MKDKVILICLFISISLVILSTGKASWQDPLQVNGSVITGSWKEPEQIGLAGELGPGAPVEELLDSTGLPVGEAEDPDAGDGLDTSTPPEENGDGVDGAGVGTVDPGMGQEPGDVAGDVEGEAEPADISGVDVSETGSSLTDNDTPDTEVDGDADDIDGAEADEADTSADDTVAGDGDDDAATDDTANTDDTDDTDDTGEVAD